MSRNGFGPNVAASLFHTMKHSNCSLTDINFTDNPIGTILIMKLVVCDDDIDNDDGDVVGDDFVHDDDDDDDDDDDFVHDHYHHYNYHHYHRNYHYHPY